MDSTDKPVWPHANYCTLTAHPSGSWCKKINGHLKYFGPLRDPDLALRRYLAFANAAVNDQPQPTVIDKSTLTLAQAMNKFLEERHPAIAAGELSAGQYARYRAITRHTLKTLGRVRPFAGLLPADFMTLRKSLTGNGTTLKNKVTWIRTIFKWAGDYYGIAIAYGHQFKKPSAVAIARETVKRDLFTPEELRAILAAANPTRKCFVLLGINCAFGQSDIATLPPTAVRLPDAVIEHARGKTGVRRINPLWPETVAALQAYTSPSPALPELFFVTQFGKPWVREPATLDAAGMVKSTTYIDAIGQEFEKLCDLAKVKRRGFYTLRHTFRSVADEIADTTAIECLMGHTKGGMGGVYTQLMKNKMQRLCAVTDHVRSWVFTQSPPP